MRNIAKLCGFHVLPFLSAKWRAGGFQILSRQVNVNVALLIWLMEKFSFKNENVFLRSVVHVVSSGMEMFFWVCDKASHLLHHA